jgi:hypothetical protein
MCKELAHQLICHIDLKTDQLFPIRRNTIAAIFVSRKDRPRGRGFTFFAGGQLPSGG